MRIKFPNMRLILRFRKNMRLLEIKLEVNPPVDDLRKKIGSSSTKKPMGKSAFN